MIRVYLQQVRGPRESCVLGRHGAAKKAEQRRMKIIHRVTGGRGS